MNRRIFCFALMGVLLLSASGCGNKKEAAVQSTAINVTVSEVKTADIEENVSYTGEVKASVGASVNAKVSGTVKSINAEIGDYVSQGAVLMTIDSTQYSLAYNQALAAYNSAVASYNNVTGGSAEQSKLNINQALTNAQSAYDSALDNYNRQKALYDIGAVSKVALDSAKTSLDNAKLALDTAKSNASLNENVIIPQTEASASAGIGQAKAALDIASSNLANCVVRAPVSGYITAKNASVGQMASPGIELFAVKDTNTVDIELNVTEAVISSITQETGARVSVKSAGITDALGTVSAVANAKNDMTGMYLVKVSVPNSDGKIKLGMLAEVSLVTDGADDVLTVSSDAVFLKDGKSYVYIAEGQKAVKKEIETGVTDGTLTQVISGLSKGDKVIVDGKDFITDTNNVIKIVK